MKAWLSFSAGWAAVVAGCASHRAPLADSNDAGGSPDGLTTEGGSPDAPTPEGGSVCEGQLVGGRCLVTLASGQDHPYAVAVDTTSLYWTNFSATPDAGTVNKVDLGSGAVATLTAGELAPHAIVADALNLYWTQFTNIAGQGAVRKMPLGGGAVTDLISGVDFTHGLVIDSTTAYFATVNSGRVDKMALAGGSAITIASGSTAAWLPTELAIDATSAYWTNWVQGNGSVMKVSLNGGPVATLASLQPWPYGIAVDTTSVYFTNSVDATRADLGVGAEGGTVMRVPLDGSAPPAAIVTMQNNPYGIVVDRTNLYWVNYGSGNSSDGAVMRASVDGTGVTTLADGQAHPYHLTVDTTSVYWANYVGGTVMRLTPK